MHIEALTAITVLGIQLNTPLSSDDNAWPLSILSSVNLGLAGCLALFTSFIYEGRRGTRRLLLWTGTLLLLVPAIQQVTDYEITRYEDQTFLVGWLLSSALIVGLLIREPVSIFARRLFIGALIVQGVAIVGDIALDNLPRETVGAGIGDWGRAIGLALSGIFLVLGFQLLAGELSEKGGALERYGRKIHKMAYKGVGRAASIMASDVAFRFWKWRHRETSFAAYYAGTISKRIERGGSHRTLGSLRHFGRSAHEPEIQSQRGVKPFERLKELGLSRDKICVDYGCGSLRVGQHVISFLESGNYIGLDLVDTFFNEGMKLLPVTAQEKAPSLLVISEMSLHRTRAARPDMIFSIAVLKHVPPDEIDSYMERILSLMHDKTIVLVDFEEGPNGFRTGANNWKHAREFLAEKVTRCNPRAVASFVTGSSSRRTFLVVRFDTAV